METPRTKEIRETNERVHNENMKSIWKARHNGTNKTTLKERSEFIKLMARD